MSVPSTMVEDGERVRFVVLLTLSHRFRDHGRISNIQFVQLVQKKKRAHKFKAHTVCETSNYQRLSEN